MTAMRGRRMARGCAAFGIQNGGGNRCRDEGDERDERDLFRTGTRPLTEAMKRWERLSG